jgi:hypothetical protein
LIERNLDLGLKDHLIGHARLVAAGEIPGAEPVIGPDLLASPRNDQAKQKPGVSAGLLIV